MDWVRVGRGEPCEVCGKPDFCTRTTDGTMAKCMRVESAKKAKGDAGGWIHRTNGTPQIAPLPAKPKPAEQDWTEFAVKCFEHERASSIRTILAQDLGVSVESLERLLVGYYFDDYRHLACSTWPEKRPGGKVVGVIRRYRVPVSDGGGNKLTMQGSRHGLYLPLDWWHGTGPVLLVEGGSDTAAALTLGLSAIGRPSNLAGVNMLIGALQDCDRPLIVLGERDRKPDRVGTNNACKAGCAGCLWCWPGLYGAKTTAERLGASLRKRVMWRLPPIESKDVRDWLKSVSEPTGGKFLRRLATR